MTAYYTTRSFLVSHIEHWLTQQTPSGVDLPSSGSHVISLGKSVLQSNHMRVNKSANMGSQDIFQRQATAAVTGTSTTLSSADLTKKPALSSSPIHHHHHQQGLSSQQAIGVIIETRTD